MSYPYSTIKTKKSQNPVIRISPKSIYLSFGGYMVEIQNNRLKNTINFTLMSILAIILIDEGSVVGEAIVAFSVYLIISKKLKKIKK
jgi:hypothetical protein